MQWPTQTGVQLSPWLAWWEALGMLLAILAVGVVALLVLGNISLKLSAALRLEAEIGRTMVDATRALIEIQEKLRGHEVAEALRAISGGRR